MTDIISDNSRIVIETLYPGVRPRAFRIIQDVYKSTGRIIHAVQGIRSMRDQMALFMKGRKLSNGKIFIVDAAEIVTNARPGLSLHCYGLAFDVAFAGADPYLQNESEIKREHLWTAYGNCVRGNGMHWGGDFKLANGAHDLPHAELAFGLSISECLELYDRGDIEAVWGHLDQLRGVPVGDAWKQS